MLPFIVITIINLVKPVRTWKVVTLVGRSDEAIWEGCCGLWYMKLWNSLRKYQLHPPICNVSLRVIKSLWFTLSCRENPSSRHFLHTCIADHGARISGTTPTVISTIIYQFKNRHNFLLDLIWRETFLIHSNHVQRFATDLPTMETNLRFCCHRVNKSKKFICSGRIYN